MSDSLEQLEQWAANKQKEGKLRLPANGSPLYIAAVSANETFDPAFLKGLCILELAMAEQGLDPEAFCINKYNASGNYPGAADTNIILYGYEVAFYDDRYEVRRKSDMEFLKYLTSLVFGDDQKPEKNGSFFSRIAAWLGI